MTTVLFLCFSLGLSAQKSEHEALMDGNEHYRQGEYNRAEEEYARALEENPNSVRGHYNRGNAIYEGLPEDASPEVRKERLGKAAESYLQAIAKTENPSVRADAYYNLGNAYLGQEDYKQAVDAYKNALRINPKDMDAKANLQKALLQQQMQQQQQQQQQGGEKEQSDEKPQGEQEQEENQQEQQQQQDPQDQPQQQDNQDPQEAADEGKKQEQPSPEDLSREEVLRQLKVMDEEEKKVLEKLRKEEGGTYNSDKDW